VLRTGQDYIESLRDGREVWIDGEQVEDVPAHPAFAPMVNVRARIYDLAREAGLGDLLTYSDEQTAERCATTSRPPRTRDDWRASSPGSGSSGGRRRRPTSAARCTRPRRWRA